MRYDKWKVDIFLFGLFFLWKILWGLLSKWMYDGRGNYLIIIIFMERWIEINVENVIKLFFDLD